MKIILNFFHLSQFIWEKSKPFNLSKKNGKTMNEGDWIMSDFPILITLNQAFLLIVSPAMFF